MVPVTGSQGGLPPSAGMGTLIAVDFKRRRRMGIRRCCPIDVTSFSNDRAGLVPRSFRLRVPADTYAADRPRGPSGQLVLIWDILDRWLAADYRYFKIRAVDQAVYFLRHDLGADEWSVVH